MFVPFLSFLYCVGHFSLAFNTGTLVFRRSTQYKVLKGYIDDKVTKKRFREAFI